MTIDDVLNNVLTNEGGYVNNPADKGGETMFGITAAVAKANGYTAPMSAMPRSTALQIYRGQYVIAPGFGLVANVSMPIAAELVDTGVNMGVLVAGRFLQRALNALTDTVLLLDGNVGAVTINALKGFMQKRGADGEKRLIALLNAEQGVRYLEITEARTANRAFLYGWLARIAA